MNILWYITLSFFFIITAINLVSYLDGIYWFLEYFTCFRVQYIIILLILCIILLLLKRKHKINIIIIIIIIFSLIPIIYDYISFENKNVNSSLKILYANVYTPNKQYHLLKSIIDEEKPDIIGLVEVGKDWVSNLSYLEKNYYFCKHPREDNFGIAIYSKFPMSGEIKYYGSLGVPSIKSALHKDNKKINIIITHPIPPKTRNYMLLRNEQLLEIGETIRKDDRDNTILLGDLNLTPWAYIFKNFLALSGLKDSRKGFGIQATWPTDLPLLLIPIDHCLVGKNFVIINRKIGDYTGSDHYPVIVELGW